MMDQAIGAGTRGRQWLRVFVVGLLLWAASVVVTFATGNTNLVPTIILLGSFLVPVTFVVYAFQHYADQVVTAQRIFTAFVYGGALGVLGASVLEAAFLRQPSGLAYVGVGLIEEAVKLAALWLLAWRLPRYSMRDGMVLGATVGFGFAALESSGYAFNALFTMEGLSLQNLVETEVLRGLLTPVGHGLWTAILGGVLFRTAARTGRPRLTGALVGWYVVVALLHALWDASRPIAVWLTLLFTGTQVQWLLIRMGRVPQPTQAQVHTFTSLTWGLLLLDALLGVACCVAAGGRRWPWSACSRAPGPPLDAGPTTRTPRRRPEDIPQPCRCCRGMRNDGSLAQLDVFCRAIGSGMSS
jgi:protease PrsW